MILDKKVKMNIKIFERKNNSLQFENIEGIYFLFRDNKVVYVGQSINIGNRIRSHKRGKKSKNQPYKKFTHYGFIEANLDSKEINDMEAFYIINFLPEYNIVIPPNRFTECKFVKDLK